MSDSISNGGCCSGSVRPGTYGNAYDVAQITVDKCGRITKVTNVAIDANAFSQWTGTKGYPIYYVPYVGIGSNVTPTSNLQVTGNVYVSNSVTTANVHVTDTLDVLGSMTANVSNATFFFDTFTIPYINTQYLNVSSNTILSGNLIAPTANIATLNVGYLTVNSAVVYGTSTLNVYGTSNLSNTVLKGILNITGNVYVSNALTTTNVFAATETLTGTTGETTLNVTGNLYVSNALTTTNIVTAGFTSNATNTVFNFDTITIPFISCTTLNVASTSNLDIVTLTGEPGITTLLANGNIYASNAVTATNVFAATAILTGATGRTTLNITGNIYVSNAVTTTNMFATYGASIGPIVLGTNVFVFSNVSGGSNVLIMNNLGRVGIVTTSPGYPLDVGTTVSIAASGNETIRSKGPVIIGNGTNDGNRFISALDSSMTTSDSRYFVLGKAGSIYNQAELSYTHDTDGSTNNKFNLGFFSKNVMTLLASGNIGIGTITPSATLHAIGNVYASNAVTTTNVFASTVSTTYPISFRNRVINGDFLIDQRNAAASSTPGVGAVVSIDRWKVNIFGSGRCLVGQNLGSIVSPTNFTSYYGMKVTTTTAVGAGDYFFFSQVIEGINTVDWLWGSANAKPVTLSFWAYSSLTGTMGGFVRNSGATAGNYTRSYPFTFSISSANTWEYKTIVIPGDTTGQWITGQVDGPEFGIELWNGTTYQSAAGAWAAGNFTGPSGGTANFAGTLNSYLYLTGIQIELGSVATQFERRHLSFELAACQRYYETTIARLGGYHTAGNFLRSSVYFNTKKRPAGSPTFTVVSTLENANMGSLSLDNSNFDQSSARILASITATGDGYGQWKVAVDCEF